jgi:phage-related protein
MTSWTLLQFRNIVDSFIEECETRIQAVLYQRLSRLSEIGNLAKRPISAYIEDGLFELRGQSGHLQPRLIYYFEKGRKIIFVHAIKKPGSKIPREDIGIAKKHRKLIQKEGEITHGIDFIN